MSLPFHLPLGQPGWVDSEASAASYRAQVVNSEWGFGGDSVFAAFQSASGPLADELRQVVAPSAGMAWHDAQTHLVRLQLMATTMRYLREQLPPGVPAPQRLILGPVEWPHDAASKVVEGGELIGPLRGPVFVIQAQDQDGFYLDPVHLFQALDSLGLWALPTGVRCPLLPAAPLPGPFAIAGPVPVDHGKPYLSVRGGSFDVLIHNPPNALPASHFSLLSSDTLEVELHNPPAGAGAVLRFADVSPEAVRTTRTPAHVDLPRGQRWTIVPQLRLKPKHAKYTPVQGKEKDPSLPLSWQLRATLGSGAALTTTVNQDLRDLIRQEYVCHRPPFQQGYAADKYPSVPERELFVRNVAPPFASHFSPGEVCTNNYGQGAGEWIANALETYRVAELMRRLLAQQLATRRIAGTLPAAITRYGLCLNSGWRNPERNEYVNGAINSNHQYGRALDLVSAHITRKTKALPSFAAERAVLHQAMFHAGGEFLRALVAANGGAACAAVEILLEQGKFALWKFVAGVDGSVVSTAGGDYKQIVGPAPPADAEAGIVAASAFASHVHVGWKPKDESHPLALPEIPPYAEIAPSPGNVYRNLILIAEEHPSVDADDQLPLNHIAESLKLALEAADPDIPTDIHVVGDTLAFLERINTFRDPPFKVRRFYSFSHAWPGGLTLTHHDLDDAPYMQPPGVIGPEVHDPVIHDRMNFFYGDGRMRADSPPLDPLEPLLPIGPDDLMQVKTNQIRISNFLFLPREALANLRVTFADAIGVYLVGCRRAEDDDAAGLSVAQAMADAIGRPVHGAAYYSKVFQRDDDGRWDELDLTRTDPAPDYARNPVVLVPGAKGGAQYLEYLREHGSAPTGIVAPQGDDLIVLYQSTLTRCDPQGDTGGAGQAG